MPAFGWSIDVKWGSIGVYVYTLYMFIYHWQGLKKQTRQRDDCAGNLQRSVPREKLVKVWGKLSKREEEAIVTQVSDFKSSPLIL